MDAKDFIFNGQSLSDYGFIIGSFGDDGTVTPGGISYTMTNVPSNDRKYISSMKYDSTIEFTFSIVKYDCNVNHIEPVDRYEDSAIHKWLEREGFHSLSFCQDDYENIHYNAYISISPKIIAGRTYGYDLQVTTDNVYAYDFECEYDFNVEADIEYSIITSSDKCGYIYPKIVITPFENGELIFNIKEDTNQSPTKFKNVKSGQVITMDCELQIIEGIDIDNFNWLFPRLLQDYDDTYNTFTTSLPCNVKISYVPRKKVMF